MDTLRKSHNFLPVCSKLIFSSFGIAAFLLEMIPFANLFFAFTNTVGAALWAADLEKNATTAPKLRDQAAKAE